MQQAAARRRVRGDEAGGPRVTALDDPALGQEDEAALDHLQLDHSCAVAADELARLFGPLNITTVTLPESSGDSRTPQTSTTRGGAGDERGTTTTL